MIDVKFEGFFDRPLVERAIDDGSKKTLSRAGAFVRTRARRSIRKRRRSSAPGEPPSSHVGTLRDRIYFFWDPATKSVVIGPTLFRQTNPTGAQLLEFGGSTTNYKGLPVTYRGNPFMKPAYEAERPTFPDLFRDSIK